ncbi:MAG: hypothetical protein IJ191_03940 [Treponema sp.]|nr:hypothetical protein [Treponema sp.]
MVLYVCDLERSGAVFAIENGFVVSAIADGEMVHRLRAVNGGLSGAELILNN